MQAGRTKQLRVTCATCGKTLTKRWLEQHIKSMHSPDSDNEQIREPCKYCGKLISSKFLQRHWKQAHPIGGSDEIELNAELTKESCPVCGKSLDCCYIHAHIAAKHSEIAENYKQIPHQKVPCPVCGYEFSVKAIKRHLLETHQKKLKRPGSDIKPFKCSNCSILFSSSRSMVRHKLRKHPPLSIPLRVKLEDQDLSTSGQFDAQTNSNQDSSKATKEYQPMTHEQIKAIAESREIKFNGSDVSEASSSLSSISYSESDSMAGE